MMSTSEITNISNANSSSSSNAINSNNEAIKIQKFKSKNDGDDALNIDTGGVVDAKNANLDNLVNTLETGKINRSRGIQEPESPGTETGSSSQTIIEHREIARKLSETSEDSNLVLTSRLSSSNKKQIIVKKNHSTAAANSTRSSVRTIQPPPPRFTVTSKKPPLHHRVRKHTRCLSAQLTPSIIHQNHNHQSFLLYNNSNSNRHRIESQASHKSHTLPGNSNNSKNNTQITVDLEIESEQKTVNVKQHCQDIFSSTPANISRTTIAQRISSVSRVMTEKIQKLASIGGGGQNNSGEGSNNPQNSGTDSDQRNNNDKKMTRCYTQDDFDSNFKKPTYDPLSDFLGSKHGKNKDVLPPKKKILSQPKSIPKYNRTGRHVPKSDFDKSPILFCTGICSKLLGYLLYIFSKDFWYRYLILGLFPAIKVAKSYKKSYIVGDICAGLTVGVVNLPQAMAYAMLAGLPAVTGLYVSIFPVLIYMLTGTSKHISIGTFAVSSLLISTAINSRMEFFENFCEAQEIVEKKAFKTCVTEQSVIYSKQLALTCGLIQFSMSILKLGFITSYLSDFMISGFTCAAALHVLTSQINKIFGIVIQKPNNPINQLYNTYAAIFKNVRSLNWLTTIISIISIIFLVIGKDINQRFKNKLWFPIPWEVFMVIISTVFGNIYLKNVDTKMTETLDDIVHSVGQTSALGGFDITKYFDPRKYSNCSNIIDCVKIVKDYSNIPAELPLYQNNHLQNLTYENFMQMLPDAAIIALVNYFIAISLARLFAVHHNYYIKPDTELRAFGLSNMISSFFGCFPCSASMSRSVLNEEVGVKTQWSALVSASLVMIVLSFLGPFFEALPICVLAAIIVVNLKRLLLETGKVFDLWKTSRSDAIVWLIVYFSVIILGVQFGLVIGIISCCMSSIIRSRHTRGVSLEPVAGVWVDATAYKSSKGTKENPSLPPGILVFRFLGPIFFANKERFTEQLVRVLKFDPATVNKNACKLDRLAKRQSEMEERIRKNSLVTGFGLGVGKIVEGEILVRKMDDFY